MAPRRDVQQLPARLTFEEYYHKHAAEVRRYLVRRARTLQTPRMDIDDLTQEVWQRVATHLASYDPTRGPFTAWVLTVTKNVLRNHWRDTGRHKHVLFGCDELLVYAQDRRADPEQDLLRDELGEQLEQTLAALPKHVRWMLQARYVRHESYEKIAKRFRLPLGTVKSQLHRGRQKFKLTYTGLVDG